MNLPLRVLFVCAGAEPGRDGVGDYSRLLASEFQKLGHAAALVALNDKAVDTPELLPGHLLRLPATLAWRERITAAEHFTADFDANWVSLQFVPYGFDPRGLSFAITRRFRSVGRGCFRHAMFHEIWTYGETVDRSLLRRGLSALQRLSIARMVQKNSLRLVHTSNQSYVEKLLGIGVSAGCLPIFSNIPLSEPSPTFRKSLTEGIPGADSPSGAWVFVFFGTIHAHWDFGSVVRRISDEAVAAGKEAIFLSIGKNPPAGEEIWHAIAASGATRCTFRKLGERPVAEVSCILSCADFGIATTPSRLLGKSGSFAAMASHGLPVIVPRIDGPPGLGASIEQGIIPVDEKFGTALRSPVRPEGYPMPGKVAASLAQEFQTLCK